MEDIFYTPFSIALLQVQDNGLNDHDVPVPVLKRFLSGKLEPFALKYFFQT